MIMIRVTIKMIDNCIITCIIKYDYDIKVKDYSITNKYNERQWII